jgi:hypothetical protein
MKKYAKKIGIAVVVVASIFIFGYSCGKKAGHPSEDQVNAEWNALSPDARYEIKEMVFKIRRVERSETVKK